jgi:hypothetical protein
LNLKLALDKAKMKVNKETVSKKDSKLEQILTKKYNKQKLK